MIEFFIPVIVCSIMIAIGCYIASFALVWLSIAVGLSLYMYWFIQGRFPWNKKF